MEKTNWQDIQKDELKYHLLKNKDRVLEYNIPYWKTLLDEVSSIVSFHDHSRVLEVGCGCCGVIMAIDQGTLVGVDPLMDDYIADQADQERRREMARHHEELHVKVDRLLLYMRWAHPGLCQEEEALKKQILEQGDWKPK